MERQVELSEVCVLCWVEMGLPFWGKKHEKRQCKTLVVRGCGTGYDEMQ
jgi:hypothetical protein